MERFIKEHHISLCMLFPEYLPQVLYTANLLIRLTSMYLPPRVRLIKPQRQRDLVMLVYMV